MEQKLTHEECMAKVNTDLPDWITGVYEEYRNDYPHLQKNWLKVCKMAKTSPKKIKMPKNETSPVLKEDTSPQAPQGRF